MQRYAPHPKIEIYDKTMTSGKLSSRKPSKTGLKDSARDLSRKRGETARSGSRKNGSRKGSQKVIEQMARPEDAKVALIFTKRSQNN